MIKYKKSKIQDKNYKQKIKNQIDQTQIKSIYDFR